MSEESHLVKHGMQRERKRTKEQHRRGAERRKEVGRKDGSPKRRRPGEQAAEVKEGEVGRKDGSPKRRRPGEQAAEVKEGEVGRKDGSPKRRRPGEQAAEVKEGEVGRKDGSPKRRRPGATRDDGCRGQSLDRAGEEAPDDCRKIPVSRCTTCRERGSAPKSSTGGEQSAVRRCKGGYGPRRTQTREVTRARWGARTAAQNDGGQVPQGASEGRSRVPTSVPRRRCVATFWTGCPFEVPRGMTAAGVSLGTEQMQRERKRTKEQHRRGAERRKEVQRWGARTAAQNDGGQVPQGASEGRSRVPTSVPRRRCVATFWTGCPFEVPRGMTAAGVSLWTEQVKRLQTTAGRSQCRREPRRGEAACRRAFREGATRDDGCRGQSLDRAGEEGPDDCRKIPMQRERKRTKEQHRRGAERRKEVQRWIWTPSDTDTGGDSGQVGRKDGSPKRRRPGAAGSLGGAKPRADERSEKVRRLRCVATFWTGCPFEVPRGMTAAGVSLWTEQMQRERKRTKEQHRRGAERRKEVQRWIWTPSDTDTGGDSGQVGRKDGSPKRRRPGAAGSLGGAKPRADERSEKVRRLRCVATFWTGCPFEVPRGMTAAGVSLWTEQVKRLQTTAGRSQLADAQCACCLLWMDSDPRPSES
ncbi:hypothetical protein GRJ2_002218500 [Grus japonensis]|uniref:Uncharacterized protein n=1 Tax=Grus japonensis TaxID=30415 RepID=A0ABC9XIM5_GRUJA